MYQYNYVKNINSSRLNLELIEAGLSASAQINTAGASISISFEQQLTPSEKTLLDGIISNHVFKTQREYIDDRIDMAVDFGIKLMRDFVSENVQLGITQRGLTGHIRKALREVKDALETGSVYDAITEIKSLNQSDFDAVIMTDARILAFRNKIESFLGVPLATTWTQKETWLP